MSSSRESLQAERRAADRRSDARRAADQTQPQQPELVERRVTDPYGAMDRADRKRLDALGFNRRQQVRRAEDRRRDKRRSAEANGVAAEAVAQRA